jgi:hypothetical protein
MKPMTVVTADKKTARPVEEREARIFSDFSPFSSA